MTADRFGIPDNVFGPHDEDFYGAIGRIALLASLLEHHIRLLAKKLTTPDAKDKPEVSIDNVIRRAREGLRRIDEPTQRDALAGFLSESKRLIKRRNFYLHSLWPAQADGTLLGWKGDPWESCERISEEDMKRDLEAFVELNMYWQHRVWPLVSWRLDPAVEATS